MTAPTRPFGDAFLMGYSAEHVTYEFGTFLWLASVCSNPRVVIGPTPQTDAVHLKNVLIEGFAVHLRNVIDFLYCDSPQPTDVVGSDFLAQKRWQDVRPKLSKSLSEARTRANKEVAHLTTLRITGAPPHKSWDFAALADELRPHMLLLVESALPARLSPVVGTVVR